MTRWLPLRRFTIYWTNMDSRRMRSPTDVGLPAVNLLRSRNSERGFVSILDAPTSDELVDRTHRLPAGPSRITVRLVPDARSRLSMECGTGQQNQSHRRTCAVDRLLVAGDSAHIGVRTIPPMRLADVQRGVRRYKPGRATPLLHAGVVRQPNQRRESPSTAASHLASALARSIVTIEQSTADCMGNFNEIQTTSVPHDCRHGNS